MTLAPDGNALLYRREDRESRVCLTLLYDGSETYEMSSDSRIAAIEPGFDFSRWWLCPLPGVALPQMPFFFSGFTDREAPLVLRHFAAHQRSEPKYVDRALYSTTGMSRDYGSCLFADPTAYKAAVAQGRSVPSGIGSVASVATPDGPKALWFDTFDNIGPDLGSLWEFKAHQRFQGVWLATEIRHRRWNTPRQTQTNEIWRDVTYTLESAVNGPLDARAYAPETYLPNHANITDATGPTPRAFVFYTDKGPLREQRAAAFADTTQAR